MSQTPQKTTDTQTTSQKFTGVNNHGLFSNHYLETQIPKTPEWKEDEKAQKVFSEIKQLYQLNQKALAAYKEAQLEDNFIRPVLRVLGHFFGIQGKVAGNAHVPDYAFFPSQDSLDEAYQFQGTQDFYQKAIAVGDAKAWGISLDKSQTSEKGMWDKQNPSYQIDTYLRDTPPVWGLLTNGRLWRLYHESTSYKLDVYYEVNLESILKSGDLDAFKYFYLFFRFEAFPKFPGDSFLDRTREGSQAYAKEIGEELQDNIYRAMQKLAEGFFADPSNGLTRTGEDLKAVQDNSMLLLYRLLFISYAESRGLLDTNNRYYHDMSLQEMKKEIATKLDAGDFLAPFSYAYWGKLNGLFDLINEGSESERWKIDRKVFYIPAYNGGLFDPTKNIFLTTKHVSDPYLAEALDLLARSEKAMVDYSSLDIKHLGSIYEGLLEYKLTPDLNLLTDKGERKATGSYYTPDYVVKYIVQNTIGPVLAQKKEEWIRAGSGKFADYILSIKVLDPAMGSGHFLVEAVDYLARALVEAWATARKEDAKNKEIAEHDIQWARREVVRKCIYGVDLNPMAVELAKLALWLNTAAANKPLSFLDHHLRCGNSLVGIDLDSLVVLPTPGKGQGPLSAFFTAQRKKVIDDLLRKYGEIDSIPDDSLKAVKEKERQFKALMEDERSQRIREVANVKLSTYFGNIVNDEDYEWMSNGIDPGLSPGWGGVRDLEWFRKAQQIAQEQRFFHWELEFPEVFMQSGFDAVIGNPPYVQLSMEEYYDENINAYLCHQYTSSMGRLNTFGLFIDRSLKFLVAPAGFLSFIVPNIILTQEYYQELRLEILKNRLVDIVVYKYPVFKGAVVETIVFKVQKAIADPENLINICEYDNKLMTNKTKKILQKYYQTTNYNSFLTKIDDENIGIKNKLENTKVVFGDVANINQAIALKFDRSKSLFKDRAADNYKPVLDGRHINRYCLKWGGDYLAYDLNNIHSCKRIDIFEAKEKIFFRRVSDRLIATYDDSQFYALNTLVVITLKQTLNISLKYVLALLNSRLLNYYYLNYLKSTKKVFSEIQARQLAQIPFHPIDLSDPIDAADYDHIVSLVDQMLDLNKQKQSEAQNFLRWLEGEIGVKVQDLSGASKLLEYYGMDFSGFHDLLIKNKRKLKAGYNPRGRENKELLEDEFNRSATKIKEFDARIEETDRQIDTLVYKLYGLTEEEIKIVEAGN